MSGETILKGILQAAAEHLEQGAELRRTYGGAELLGFTLEPRPGGRLSFVAMSPNVKVWSSRRVERWPAQELPGRIKTRGSCGNSGVWHVLRATKRYICIRPIKRHCGQLCSQSVTTLSPES